MNIHAECVTTAAAIATALPHQQQAMEKQTIEKVFRSHLHRASNCNCCNKWITTTTTTENIAVTVNFFAIVSRHLQSAKSILHVQRFAAIKVIARCSMNLNVRTNNFFIAAAAQQQWNVLALFVLRFFSLAWNSNFRSDLDFLPICFHELSIHTNRDHNNCSFNVSIQLWFHLNLYLTEQRKKQFKTTRKFVRDDTNQIQTISSTRTAIWT